MEGFTYNNIFETKGIEYLVIIAFFAILIPIWLILNRKVKLSEQISKVTRLITPGSIRIPQGVFFSKFHSWAHLETNGDAKVGIDDLLLHFTGEVKIENTKSPGEIIKKGDLLTMINHKGKILKILSPISGEIKGINQSLFDNPTPINEDFYQQLWIYTIKPTNWKSETGNYYLAEEATIWMLQELTRFKDFVAAAVSKYIPESPGIVLQDGGELVDQPLAELPEEIWQEFQDKFLS